MIEKPVLDHIGIAVESIDSGLAIYRALGIEVEGVEEVADQKVRVAFLPVGDTRIELLEPTDTPRPSPATSNGGALGCIISVSGWRTSERRWRSLSAEGYRLLSEEPLRGSTRLPGVLHPPEIGGRRLDRALPGDDLQTKADRLEWWTASK